MHDRTSCHSRCGESRSCISVRGRGPDDRTLDLAGQAGEVRAFKRLVDRIAEMQGQ
jgi:hypothetical protein